MRKKIIKLIPVGLVAALLLAMTGLALAAPPVQDETPGGIVDLAVASGDLTTLVQGIQDAGLDETLQGEGPFTVFAPTDEAFAQLPAETVESLFADIPALTDLLLYHVADGSLAAADLAAMEQIETLTGRSLTVSGEEGSLVIQGAQVVTGPIAASNGVVYVIDTVLLPPAGEEEAMMEETAVQTDTMESTEAMTETMESTEAMTEAMESEAMAAEAGGLCSERYVVQAGESLSGIAVQFFGDDGAFTQIVEATNTAAQSDTSYQAIDDPNIILVGQALCIPAAAGTAPAADVAATTTATGTTAMTGTMVATGTETMMPSMMVDVPEGQSALVFENLSSVDLVFDLSGPTRASQVVPPSGQNTFIVDPGGYKYNAHQPGGAYAVAPGEFELAAGEAKMLTCYDGASCQILQSTAPMTTPTMEEGMMMEEGTEMMEGEPAMEETESMEAEPAMEEGESMEAEPAMEDSGSSESMEGGESMEGESTGEGTDSSSQ